MADPERASTNGTPRWVKVSGIIAIVLVLLLAILLLSGRGHGPGRHMSFGGTGSGFLLSSVAGPGSDAGPALRAGDRG